MTKKATSILSIVILFAIVGGFLYWQMSQLSKGIQTMPVKNAEEVLVSAFSAVALAPGLDENASASDGTEPLLDQYQKNPALIHKRYLLVITWMRAGKIFKAMGNNPPVKGQVFSSASLTDIPQEDGIDGWGNSYCIFANSKQIAFLSSGGNGALICEKIQQVAKKAASSTSDSRLTKEGSLLLAVFRRSGNAPLIRP